MAPFGFTLGALAAFGMVNASVHSQQQMLALNGNSPRASRSQPHMTNWEECSSSLLPDDCFEDSAFIQTQSGKLMTSRPQAQLTTNLADCPPSVLLDDCLIFMPGIGDQMCRLPKECDEVVMLDTGLPPYEGSRHLGEPKSRILFLHAWKAGGTNLCDMAMRNGEAVPRSNIRNVNARCDAGYSDGEFASALKSIDYSFIAWQAPMPRSFTLGAEWVFVVLMRNPLNQALSHYQHVQKAGMMDHKIEVFRNFSSFVEFGECVRESGPSRLNDEACGANQPISFIRRANFNLFRDNIQLRWLMGMDSGTEIQHRLQAADLQEAKKRLAMADKVLILEAMHNRDRWQLAELGWHDLDDHPDGLQHAFKHAWFKKSHHTDTAEYFNDQPQVMKRLVDLQKWDLALYDHAKDVAKARAAAINRKRTY